LIRLVARWGVAVVVSAAGFALAWWVCGTLIGLDEGASLGIAGAVLAVLVAVAAWWAPRGAESGTADDSGGRPPVQQADPARDKLGNVTNTISGGAQHGPVLQGRDFTGLTFGANPAPPALPRDPDTGT
jgi:hypothetical protein